METENVIDAAPKDAQTHHDREPIEVLRSALCALTYNTPHQFEPVHVRRIKACCERFGLSENVKQYLEILQLLREYEDLGEGYWAPTPQRFVKLPGCRLIIAPNPTTELQRWFGDAIQSAGYARVYIFGSVIALPEQTADDWIGSPGDLSQWTQGRLNYAKNNLRPTIHPDGRIEVYCPWAHARNPGRVARKRWVELEELDFDENDEPLLCRIKGVAGTTWFFAATKAQRVVAECEISHGEVLRLLYGLDALHGTSATLRVIKDGDQRRITLSMTIPEEEQRLLLALAQRGDDNGQEYYEFDSHHCAALEFGFRRLGFSLGGCS